MSTAPKAVIGITPTFTLRRIDPKEILQKYHAGAYEKVVLPKNKIRVSAVPTVVQPTLSSSPDDGIYAFRLRNNNTQVIATSNVIAYKFFTTNSTSLPVGGECQYCRKTFKTEALGIPIRMVEDQSEEIPKIFYYMDDCSYCSFECVLSALKQFNGFHYRYRDPLYMDPEQILRYLYSHVHPESGILREAPDFRLHRRHNGPLEDEDFHSKKHAYLRTPNVILAPLKVQYHRTG